MLQVKIKRVYDPASPDDGYRVLVDKLWPRGVRKDALHYDLWAKDITPSTPLREWFHVNPDTRWMEFKHKYTDELQNSEAVQNFVHDIADKGTVTLLYASKNAAHNHALILQDYLEKAAR